MPMLSSYTIFISALLMTACNLIYATHGAVGLLDIFNTLNVAPYATRVNIEHSIMYTPNFHGTE